MDDMRGAADDIAAWAGAQGVDYLFQIQGKYMRSNMRIYLTTENLPLHTGGPAAMTLLPTPESMTVAFNVQMLSHFLIPYILLSHPQPILRDGAQVCTICRPDEQD